MKKAKMNITLESLKSNPLVITVWQIAGVVLFYLILGTYWLKDYSKVQIFAYMILGLFISLFVHELVHCIFMRLFSKKKITFGFKRNRGSIGYCYVKVHDNLKRWQGTIVKLSPAVSLTVIPTIVMLLSGYRSAFSYAFVMLNFNSSYLDFIDTIILWQKKE